MIRGQKTYATMTHTLLITDLDDTLYSWVDFYSPCLRAMVHVISKETGIDEEQVTEQFKRVYSKHGSLEYSYAVQELELCKDLPDDEIDRLVALALIAFGNTRKVHLKSYEGVKETLSWAVESGISIVGITNSPMDLAIGRLKNLGLYSYFSGLAAWEGYKVPSYHTTHEQLRSALRLKENKNSNGTLRTWSLSEEELKPNPVAYTRILNDLNVSRSATCVVGDSLYKDIAPAKEIGVMTVCVDYKDSFRVDPKNKETLNRITHWGKDRISKVYEDKSVEATHEIYKYEQLKKYLKPPQQSLFPPGSRPEEVSYTF